MCWGELITLGVGLFAADKQADKIDDAVGATKEATDQQINFARDSRNLALLLSDPYRQSGYAAMAAMMDMMGLPRMGPPGGTDDYLTGSDLASNPYPVGSPEWFVANRDINTQTSGPGSSTATLPPGVTSPDMSSYPAYDWKADPSYDWRFKEGIRSMDASSSAKGLGLSGGYGKALTKYGQDMASQEYMNIYNRLAALAGFSQVGTQAGVNAAMNYGNVAANAVGGYGATRASGYIAQGNTMAGMYGDIASVLGNLPWDDWFGRSSGSGGGVPIGNMPGDG